MLHTTAQQVHHHHDTIATAASSTARLSSSEKAPFPTPDGTVPVSRHLCDLSKRPPLLASILLCRLLITIQPRNVLATICPSPPTVSDSSRDQSRGPPEPFTSFDHVQKPGNRVASRVSICSPHLLAPAASPLGIINNNNNMPSDSLHQAFDMVTLLRSSARCPLFLFSLASSISTSGNSSLSTSFRLVSSSCKSSPSFQMSSRTSGRTSLLFLPLPATPWSRPGPARRPSSALPCLIPSVLPHSNVTVVVAIDSTRPNAWCTSSWCSCSLIPFAARA
ncbi:hypothetical protein BKA81DRAFT_162344 [Phyllosticta paracitricarpa]|uniref:Uncharacterized protein n=2 Tax=Phyllosticta TaxID=121621 RepID=A0ABR1MSW1_9PEZI